MPVKNQYTLDHMVRKTPGVFHFLSLRPNFSRFSVPQHEQIFVLVIVESEKRQL